MTGAMAEVDYWFGGLVAGGITPHLGWNWSENSTLVANVQKWLHAYVHFGHLTEDGIHPLFFDTECCHLEGVCEWRPAMVSYSPP
eukprot:SAG11_NODE_8466_length_1012_cov_0.763417_2_plen_85_part_00